MQDPAIVRRKCGVLPLSQFSRRSEIHILPTRGRPRILQRYFDEGCPREPGIVVVDTDQRDMYADVQIPNNWTALFVQPMQGFVAKVNLAFKVATNEPWYSFEGDDCVGRPNGWDTKLGERAAKGYITYGDDLFNHKVTHPYICGDFCRDIGWVAHPAFKHLYVDVIWEVIGKTLGILEYMPDMITEAHHFANGKLPMDKTARERMQHRDHGTWDIVNKAGFMKPIIEKLRLRCESYSR